LQAANFVLFQRHVVDGGAWGNLITLSMQTRSTSSDCAPFKTIKARYTLDMKMGRSIINKQSE